MAGRTTKDSKKDKHDPWGAIAHEFPEHTHDGRIGGDDDEKDDTEPRASSVALTRFFALLFWRPFEAIISLIGLLCGATILVLFARGSFRVFDPDTYTVVMTWDGIFMLLAWVLVPPLWFFTESFVFCKTAEARAALEQGQSYMVKIWLAMFFAMVILAKEAPPQQPADPATTGVNMAPLHYPEEEAPMETPMEPAVDPAAPMPMETPMKAAK